MPAINIIIMIILTSMALILLGLAAVIQNNTIIEWWIPVSVCLALAIPSGFL